MVLGTGVAASESSIALSSFVFSFAFSFVPVAQLSPLSLLAGILLLGRLKGGPGIDRLTRSAVRSVVPGSAWRLFLLMMEEATEADSESDSARVLACGMGTVVVGGVGGEEG